MLLKLTLALPQPRVPSLPPAPDDVLCLQLERHLLRRLGLRLGLAARLLLVSLALSLGLTEELPPTLRGPQLLRQLITTLLP